MSYIRKNHLTINEDEKVYEIVTEDGQDVEWFGSEADVTELLGTDDWVCGDTVVADGLAYNLVRADEEISSESRIVII